MNKIIFALFASLAAMTAAHAEGPYAGIGVNSSHYDLSISNATRIEDKSGRVYGGKLFAGYEFDKTWGIETGYANFGNASSRYVTSSAAGTLDVEMESVYLAGKANIPINEQFSLFGKLGAARNHFKQTSIGSSSSENKADLYAALGAQYAFNKQLALSLEWEHYGKSGENSKASTLTTALQFHF